jgi:heterotetrameric sarcosine oxidase gamma subunit
VPEVTLIDRTGQAVVLVRASPGGEVAAGLGVPPGRAARTGDGTLVVRTAPDAWLLLAGPASRFRPIEAAGEFVNVFDLTHGYALLRLTGRDAAGVLARVCAIDLSDAASPDGTAFRALVAGLAATVVRDDGAAGARSYLVACDRSYSGYLVDVLTDAAAY